MNDRQLYVHYLPQFVADHELAGRTVIVIDLLRATTTICQALASGAREVIPFVEIAEALAAAGGECRGDVLLGGERAGARIEGFDLGNSPAEYSPEVVFGRKILLTTTNGTRALHHARLAGRVLVGAIVNLSAVVASVRDDREVDILCAGTAGHVTREDILAAGAMVSALCGEAAASSTQSPDAATNSSTRWQTNEHADAARSEWEELLNGARAAGRPVSEQLALELRDTAGGRNLLELGMDHDLADCARIDLLDAVPVLDVPSWRITLL